MILLQLKKNHKSGSMMCGGQIIKTVSELFKISSNIGRDVQTNKCIDGTIETQDTREKKMT